MKREIDTLIRRISPVSDAEVVRLVSAETTRDLADRITATSPNAHVEDAHVEPVPPRRRRRIAIGLPLAAGLAAAVAVTAFVESGGTPVTPEPTGTSSARQLPKIKLASALTFTKRGGFIEVRVRDPLADPKRYREEFAEHGLQIQLSLVPGSPSIVGTVVMIETSPGPGNQEISTISAKGKCVTGGGGDICPVGVRIPLDYRGKGGVVFARAARPGEQYNSTAPANAPGEAMHGLAYRNRTVAEVLVILKKRHVTVPEYRYTEEPEGTVGFTHDLRPEQVSGSWYVHDAAPWAKDQVLLFIGPEPATSPR